MHVLYPFIVCLLTLFVLLFQIPKSLAMIHSCSPTVYVPPHKRLASEKPLFSSSEQKQYKAMCSPPVALEYGPLLREFVCPNALPVCTRCGEMSHTKAICLKFKTKICENCVNGMCEFDPCWFSRDEESLRSPKKQICIRVRMGVFLDKEKTEWKRVKVYGCGKEHHRYQNCPVRKKLIQVCNVRKRILFPCH